MSEEEFIKRYEELLDKDYCNCNEMNCIDNNSPRRILNIVKALQKENKLLCKQLDEQNDLANEYYKRIDKAIEEIKKELEENHHLSYGVALTIINMLDGYKLEDK